MLSIKLENLQMLNFNFPLCPNVIYHANSIRSCDVLSISCRKECPGDKN